MLAVCLISGRVRSLQTEASLSKRGTNPRREQVHANMRHALGGYRPSCLFKGATTLDGPATPTEQTKTNVFLAPLFPGLLLLSGLCEVVKRQPGRSRFRFSWISGPRRAFSSAEKAFVFFWWQVHRHDVLRLTAFPRPEVPDRPPRQGDKDASA